MYLIPPIGGPERKLAEQVNSVDWMPDSRSPVVGYATNRQQGGIGVIGIDSGETRRLTTAPGRGTDAEPAVSPDGRSVAFNRLTGSRFDIYVAPTAGGEPRRITKDGRFIWGLTWADKREIVFSSTRSSIRELWRVPADGNSAPSRVEGVDGEAM